jgi:hypothetical protein
MIQPLTQEQENALRDARRYAAIAVNILADACQMQEYDIAKIDEARKAFEIAAHDCEIAHKYRLR